MDSSTSCPFCHLLIPNTELLRHANSHFEDEGEHEQLAKDLELAQQNSSSPPTSELPFDDSTLGNTSGNNRQYLLDEKISCLISSQNRSSFYNVDGGLISLLHRCLEQEPENSTTYLCGYVHHFCSIVSEDVGWGCGWRNIQMLASHLLAQTKDAKNVLFGGSGFVPDIPSLQRWLEIAWQRGYDRAGADHFNHTIYGSREWIGTTECAALFRSFGFRARVVDFSPKELEPFFLSVPDTNHGTQVFETKGKCKRQRLEVYGPMDRYIYGTDTNGSQRCPTHNETSKECTEDVQRCSRTKIEGHQILMDWVWNYFSNGSSTICGSGRVIISNKTPLYFQHDGHSRTIVGIQVKIQKNGTQLYNLLIMDPSHSTAALERSLKENIGWKKLIKRGVHTMKKPQYQLCFIEPGIASEEEMEQLKTMDSTLITL